LANVLPLLIFNEHKQVHTDTRYLKLYETMSRQFKQEVLFRVTVDVNGKQEYAIHTRDYDELCDKLTDVMIKETL
jgi:hypothetical protein